MNVEFYLRRNQTMYRTWLLTAVLLLAGCSKPVSVAPDPLAVGSEIFLNQLAVNRLNKLCDAHDQPHFTVGTKVRVVERAFDETPPKVRVLVLEGEYANCNAWLLKSEVFFAH